LNNANGIPSACEYDMPGLMSMVLLSNMAKSAAYMGNTIPNPLESIVLRSFDEPAVKEELKDMDNLVMTWHSVPNLKLKGFESPALPYAIRPFAHSGWGATLRYDFSGDKGQAVTMCRIDPTCSKLFVAKGKIVAGIGYDKANCTLGVLFQVRDSRDFFEKISLVGNHNPLVYGDYFDRLVKLGKILGLEVITS
jgi:L-fucose isomerase-like protein